MALTRQFYRDLGIKGRGTKAAVAEWLGKQATGGWWNSHLSGSSTCCSAVELSDLVSTKDAQIGICTALQDGERNVFYYCVRPNIGRKLEEWGFKKIASFPGNHHRRVNVYFNQIARN